MLEPAVSTQAVSALAKALLDRAAAADPTVRAERDLFRPLARAYFRDRERALAGVATPLTTLMLEASRRVWDHLVDSAIRWGRPVPADPLPYLAHDYAVHDILTEVLTHHGRLTPARAARLATAVAGNDLLRGAA